MRSVPGNKVHAVCKMHQINCAGILGCCATNFETRPRFHVIFVIFFTDLFNVFLFFAGRNTAGCSTKYILWIFKKGPPQAPLFSVWIVAKTNWYELIPSIWKQFKNTRYTFKQKQHIYLFIYLFLSLMFIYLFLLFYFYSRCFFLMFIFNMYFLIYLFFLGNSLNSSAGLEFQEFRFFSMIIFQKQDWNSMFFFETF